MTLKAWIELAAALLTSNIAVTMSLVLVIAKLCMVRIAADKDSQLRNILRVPEELTYIALSFVLAGLSGDMKAFRSYFSDTTHSEMSIAILFVIACAVCMAVHFAES